MIISNMTMKDFELMKDNFNKDFDDFWNVNILKQELENPNSKYIVVKENENIFGFAGILITPSDSEIMNIVVRKDCRNQGIGTMLIQKLINMSKESNMDILTLEVNETNLFAIRLYEKCGFKKVGIRRNYYNNQFDAIIMNLNLNNINVT